jgi:hypothetical protein
VLIVEVLVLIIARLVTDRYTRWLRLPKDKDYFENCKRCHVINKMCKKGDKGCCITITR